MKLAILAGVLAALGIAGILVATIKKVDEHHHVERTDYGIVLDAGSTSTKAYIYSWDHKTKPFIPFVALGKSKSKELYTYDVSPGLATLAPNYTAVGDYLEPILSWARTKIPNDVISSTPVYLQATGGVRQLSDFSASTLLSSVRYKLQNSGFQFTNENADILKGTEEAGYGFLAVNSLYERFQNSEDAYGSLDMGGESSNIAYKSYSPPMNYSFSFNVNTSLYTVYAQNIDGLGVNSARNTLINLLFLNSSSNIVTDPCIPIGYSKNTTISVAGELHSFYLMGSSDPDNCQFLVKSLVRQLTQSLPKPSIGDTTFALADHYIKAKKFYKLKDNANILELEAKTYSFCGLRYSEALDHHNKFWNDVQDYCFNGFYMTSLLEDFYGFDSATRHLLWQETVHHQAPVTWTLGFMIDQVSLIAPDTSKQEYTKKVHLFHNPAGMVLLFVSVMFVILGIILYILDRQHHRRVDYVAIR